MSRLGGIDFSHRWGKHIVGAIVALVFLAIVGWPKSRGDAALEAKDGLAKVYLAVCANDAQRAAVTGAIAGGHEAAFEDAYLPVSESWFGRSRHYRLNMERYAQAVHPLVIDAAARVGPDDFVAACDAEYREFMREIKRSY